MPLLLKSTAQPLLESVIMIVSKTAKPAAVTVSVFQPLPVTLAVSIPLQTLGASRVSE